MQQHADSFIMKPPGIANRLYTYTVFPAGNANGAGIESYTKKLISADLPGVATTNDPYKLNKVVNQFYSVTYGGKDKNGKTIALSYLIYEGENDAVQVARVLTENNRTFYEPYLKTSMQHFMKLVGWKKGAEDNRSSTAKKERTKTPRKPKVSYESITAAPGQGLKASEIEGIYINFETGFGVGGYVTSEYNPYLLLKDKSIYRRLHIDPSQLDVQKSKELEPDQWGTWKQSGKQIIVSWNTGKSSTWSTYHKTIPAKGGEKLSGYYRTISGGGNVAYGGDVITFAQDGITFFQDGTYTRGKSGGGMSESSTATKTTNTSGTYSLSGYKILLKENNGATSELAFYYFPDKQKQASKTAIGIGSNVYSTPSDKK